MVKTTRTHNTNIAITHTRFDDRNMTLCDFDNYSDWCHHGGRTVFHSKASGKWHPYKESYICG